MGLFGQGAVPAAAAQNKSANFAALHGQHICMGQQQVMPMLRTVKCSARTTCSDMEHADAEAELRLVCLIALISAFNATAGR